MKAYRALGRFRRGAPLRPWLLQIVANEARNRRRSAGRRDALALRAAAAEAPSGGAAPSPEGDVLAAERRDALLGGLARLRDEDREILGCRYLLELSEQETCARARAPAGHGEVAHRPRARAPAGRAGGGGTVTGLEQELRTLSVEWPATPDLAAALAPHLAAPPARRRAWSQTDRDRSRDDRRRGRRGARRLAGCAQRRPSLLPPSRRDGDACRRAAARPRGRQPRTRQLGPARGGAQGRQLPAAAAAAAARRRRSCSTAASATARSRSSGAARVSS